jgi:hypothetical protein
VFSSEVLELLGQFLAALACTYCNLMAKVGILGEHLPKSPAQQGIAHLCRPWKTYQETRYAKAQSGKRSKINPVWVII